MATPGQLQMYNKLEIGEMFGLDHRAYDSRIDKIHRIHIYTDEKVDNAVIFHIWLEDHTLGNILRMELLRNEDVLFAGYKVPHPLNHMIELRVQTLPKSSPEQAVRHAIANLRQETRSMLEQFDAGCMALRGGAAPLAGPDTDEVMRGAETDHGFSTSDALDGPLSPHTGGEDGAQRFQAEFERFEQIQMAHRTSTSFSPSYSPSGSPQEEAGGGRSSARASGAAPRDPRSPTG